MRLAGGNVATIYHQVRTNAPILNVYRAVSAVNGIAHWWNKPTATQMDVGSVLELNPGAQHGVLRMKVLELLPDRRVEWECISTHPETSPASEWTGTHVVFEITESVPMVFEITRRRHMAVLDFRHSGWDETSKYFGFCNFGWGEALLKLKKRCESK
jgi:uncharacterized protein YndB with AHSA1/START domain